MRTREETTFYLIDIQHRIAADDCSGRKIDTLSHQMPSQTPLLALQPFPNRLDGLSGFGCCLRDAADAIVTKRVDVVLQKIHELAANVFAGTIRLMFFQDFVGLQQIQQLSRQVILGPVGTEGRFV